MEKIRKKGYLEVDLIAGIVIVLFLFLLAASLQFVQTQPVEINVFKATINNDLFLINLLKADGQGTSIRDIIVKDYSSDDFSMTKTEINKRLLEAFGEKPCWTLIMNDKTTGESSGCKKMSDMDLGDIDAVSKIPIIKNDKVQVMTVRLKG
jgi:hypothetical protein